MRSIVRRKFPQQPIIELTNVLKRENEVAEKLVFKSLMTLSKER